MLRPYTSVSPHLLLVLMCLLNSKIKIPILTPWSRSCLSLLSSSLASFSQSPESTWSRPKPSFSAIVLRLRLSCLSYGRMSLLSATNCSLRRLTSSTGILWELISVTIFYPNKRINMYQDVVACACNPAKKWKLQTDSAEDAGSKLSHVFRMVTFKGRSQT